MPSRHDPLEQATPARLFRRHPPPPTPSPRGGGESIAPHAGAASPDPASRGHPSGRSPRAGSLPGREREDAHGVATLPVIDAHQHFWDLSRNPYPWLQDPEPIPFRYGDYAALKRNYLPADFERDVAPFRVMKSVHVEAEWERANPVAETEWLEALAAREGRPQALVAHAALDRPDAEEVLAHQARHGMVRGIRYKPAAAASPTEARRGLPGSMDDPVWRRGYAMLARHGLSFDLQTPWWHLDAAAELAADFPGTQIVINHTGLPSDRSEDALRGWRHALGRVAAKPNVAIKISGLGQAGRPWTVAENGPIIRDAIAIFGVERCLYASNFPVDSLVASYATILSGFFEAIADRPECERRRLVHDNAERIYRL